MDKIIVRMRETECLYEEKIDLIKGGICSSIFPLNIIRCDSSIMGYYKTSGYRMIGSYNELTAKSIFIALEKIFQAIEDCTQFLIFPEEFVINLSTIYIDERFTHVKFVYIPDEKCRYKNRMQILINELKQITNDEGKYHLEKLEKIVSEENLSYLKNEYMVAKILGEIKNNKS